MTHHKTLSAKYLIVTKRYILIFEIITYFSFFASHFWYRLHFYAEKICRHCTTDTTTKKVDIDVEWRAILERRGGRNFSRSHSMILRFLGHTMGWLSFLKSIINSMALHLHYTANIYSGNWDTRKKCKSYKYLP